MSPCFLKTKTGYQSGTDKWSKILQILHWFYQFFMTVVLPWQSTEVSERKNQSLMLPVISPAIRIFKRGCLLFKWWDVIHFLEFISQLKENRAQLERLKEQKFIMQQRSCSPQMRDVGCSQRMYTEALAAAGNDNSNWTRSSPIRKF